MNRKVLIVLLFVAALAAVGSCALRQKSRPPVVTAPPVVGPSLPDPLAVILYDTSGSPQACSSSKVQAPLQGVRLSFTPAVHPLATRRRSATPPVPLRRFCVIRPPNPPPTSQGPLARPRIPLAEAEKLREVFTDKGYEVGFDYPLVQGAGDLDLLPRPEQRAAFQQRAGAVGTSTWPTTAPVRLALIDSLDASGAGWTYANLSSDNHGAPLGRLIEELTCVSGIGDGTKPCLVDLVAYDALHNVSATGEPAGTLHDLADAIIAAVDGDDGHKVINISLGWVPLPSLGNVDPNQPMPTPTKAVYEALKYAACHDAVVFAAGGNYLGGPNGTFDSGLVYPAGWQADNTAVQCDQYGGAGQFNGSLVHAVGGLGASSDKIGLSRPGGFPTLAAFGVDGVSLKVVGSSTKPKDHTLPMSGTSVATAVVSAAAAARWALDAGPNNEAIVDALRQSPSSLQGDIKYDNTYDVKKIDACEQATEGCNSSSCGGTFVCPTVGNPAPSAATLALIAPSLATATAPKLKERTCSGHTVWGVPGNTTCMDNFTTSVDATPWVHPMPGCDPCVGCILTLAGDFFGELNGDCSVSSEAWAVRFDGVDTHIIDVGGIIQAAGLGAAFQNGGGVLLKGLGAPAVGPAVSARVLTRATAPPASVSTAAELPLVP